MVASTYIVKGIYQKNQCIHDIERDLNLLNSCIKSFLKVPEDLDKYGDLILKKLQLERSIISMLYPNPLNDNPCISPPWDSIGNTELNHAEVQNLKLELDLIRKNKYLKTSVKPKKGKCKVPILEVLSKAGLVLKNGFILCPFHAERNPSCKIYFHTNTFYCFSCHKWGTASDLADALGVKL